MTDHDALQTESLDSLVAEMNKFNIIVYDGLAQCTAGMERLCTLIEPLVPKAPPIGQAPEETPQFEVGQRVLINQEGFGQGLKGRIEVCQRVENARKGDWHYLVWCGDNVALWVFGVDLELADEARIPKPKFEKGQTVRVASTGREVRLRELRWNRDTNAWQYRMWDAITWSDASYFELADEAPRQELPETPPRFYGREMRWKLDDEGNPAIRPPECDEHYLLRGEIAMWHYPEPGSHVFPICELVSEPDEAPRQELPDTPPDYEGPDGKVKMHWVRGANGEIAHEHAEKDEFYFIDKYIYHAGERTRSVWPICEPVPVVQGWDGEWLRLGIRDGKVATAVLAQSHAMPCDSVGGTVYMSIPASSVVLPSIPIPEVPNA